MNKIPSFLSHSKYLKKNWRTFLNGLLHEKKIIDFFALILGVKQISSVQNLLHVP